MLHAVLSWSYLVTEIRVPTTRTATEVEDEADIAVQLAQEALHQGEAVVNVLRVRVLLVS